MSIAPAVLLALLSAPAAGAAPPRAVSADASVKTRAADSAALNTARRAIREMGRGSRCELSRDGRRLRVVGPTDPGLADCLERYDGRPGLTVVVTSPGGDVDQAMRAAEVIGRRGWALEVLGLCGSSCGNYLVPAASRVEVAPYSVIGLHGCPDETNIANARANGRERLRRAAGPRRSPEWLDAQHAKLIADVQGLVDRNSAWMRRLQVDREWCRLSAYPAPGSGRWFAVMGGAELQRNLPKVRLGPFWEANTPAERKAVQALTPSRLVFAARPEQGAGPAPP